MRDAVGEASWQNARRIQKQLSEKKKSKAIQKAAQSYKAAHQQDGAIEATKTQDSTSESESTNNSESEEGVSTDDAKASSRSTSSITNSNSSSDEQGPITKKKPKHETKEHKQEAKMQKQEPMLLPFANVTTGSATNEGSSSPSDEEAQESDEAQNGGSSSGNSDEATQVDKTIFAPPQTISAPLNTKYGGLAAKKRRLFSSRSTFAKAASRSFSEFSSLTGFSSDDLGPANNSSFDDQGPATKKQKQEPTLQPFANVTTDSATNGSTSSPSDEAQNGGSSSSNNSDEGMKIAKPMAALSQGLLGDDFNNSMGGLAFAKGASRSSSSLSNSSSDDQGKQIENTTDSAAHDGFTSPSDGNEGSSSSNSDGDTETNKPTSTASKGSLSLSSDSNNRDLSLVNAIAKEASSSMLAVAMDIWHERRKSTSSQEDSQEGGSCLS